MHQNEIELILKRWNGIGWVVMALGCNKWDVQASVSLKPVRTSLSCVDFGFTHKSVDKSYLMDAALQKKSCT